MDTTHSIFSASTLFQNCTVMKILDSRYYILNKDTLIGIYIRMKFTKNRNERCAFLLFVSLMVCLEKSVSVSIALACKQICRVFWLWLMWKCPTYCDHHHSITSDTGWYQKSRWSGYEEWVSRKHPPLFSASVSAFKFLPSLISRIKHELDNEIHDFLSKLVLVMMCYWDDKNPKTTGQ